MALNNFKSVFPQYAQHDDAKILAALKQRYPQYAEYDDEKLSSALEQRYAQQQDPAVNPQVNQPMERLKTAGHVVRGTGKGLARFSTSAPSIAGGVMMEAGERAEEEASLGDEIISQSMAFGIPHQLKNLKAAIFKNTDVDEKLADTGRELMRRNQAWLAKYIPRGDSKTERFFEDLGSGAGSLALSIGLTALTKNPNLAAVVFGVMAKSGMYADAREAGKDPRTAGNISGTVGVLEGVLEKVGLDMMLKPFGNRIRNTIVHASSEYMQEFLQSGQEGTIAELTGVRHEGMKQVLANAAYEGLMGAILGGGASVVLHSEHPAMKDLVENYGLKKKDAAKLLNHMAKLADEEAKNVKKEVNPDDIEKTIENMTPEETEEIAQTITQEIAPEAPGEQETAPETVIPEEATLDQAEQLPFSLRRFGSGQPSREIQGTPPVQEVQPEVIPEQTVTEDVTPEQPGSPPFTLRQFGSGKNRRLEISKLDEAKIKLAEIDARKDPETPNTPETPQVIPQKPEQTGETDLPGAGTVTKPSETETDSVKEDNTGKRIKTKDHEGTIIEDGDDFYKVDLGKGIETIIPKDDTTIEITEQEQPANKPLKPTGMVGKRIKSGSTTGTVLEENEDTYKIKTDGGLETKVPKGKHIQVLEDETVQKEPDQVEKQQEIIAKLQEKIVPLFRAAKTGKEYEKAAGGILEQIRIEKLKLEKLINERQSQEQPATKPVAEKVPEQKEATKPGKTTVTDKSVRDLPQQIVVEGDTIKVRSKDGRKIDNEYTITRQEWEEAQRGPSANPEWNMFKLVEKKFKESATLDESPEGQNITRRMIDSQIMGIKKAMAKEQETQQQMEGLLEPAQDTRSQKAKDIDAHLKEIAKNLKGAAPVIVVDNTDQLPEHLATVINKLGKQKAKGLYDKHTKTVYIVADNQTDADQAVYTFMHEQVGHYSLKEMLGDKYSEAMLEVRNHVGIGAIQTAIPVGYQKLSEERQTEEYLARLAVKMMKNEKLTTWERTAWQKFIDFIKEMLHIDSTSIAEKIVIESYVHLVEGKQDEKSLDTKDKNDNIPVTDTTGGKKDDTELSGRDPGVLGGQEAEAVQKPEDEEATGQPGKDDTEGDDRGLRPPSEAVRGNDESGTSDDDGKGNSKGSVSKRNVNNYRLSPETITSKSFSPKRRFRENIAAIKLLKKLEKENRPATAEEKDVLVKYVGWGGLAEYFNYSRDLKDDQQKLSDLLTQEEYNAARRSTINAHYTSAEIISNIWNIAQQLGFKGGNILEPGMGIGHFFGLMPENIHSKSKLFGVELDPLTARIGKMLYSDADITQGGFEDQHYPDDYFDVAVSNVPFSENKFSDMAEPNTEFGRKKFSLHNFFFAKAIEKVRPGGLVMFVTSSYTMDSQSTSFRDYISGKANFIGSIRFPNDAFSANANTKVVADLVILQKKGEGVQDIQSSWKDVVKKVKKVKDKYENPLTVPYVVNEYFDRNKDMVLGRTTVGMHGQYGKWQKTVEPWGKVSEKIIDAIKRLPKNIMTARKKMAKPIEMAPQELLKLVKKGGYFIQDGVIKQRVGNEIKEVKLSPEKEAKVKGMLGIRDTAKSLLAEQMNSDDDTQVMPLMKELNRRYDAFVEKHGDLSKRTNAGLMRTDPDYYFLKALEKMNSATEKMEKAEIFNQRVFNKAVTVTSAKDAKDAMVVSYNQRGIIDLEYMAELSGLSKEQIVKDLAGQIFQDPKSESWVSADEYLSGNVGKKLKYAKAAAKHDSAYKENVKALEEVQPDTIPYLDIKVTPSAGWLPPSVVQQYADRITGTKNGIHYKYLPTTAEWVIEGQSDYMGTTENDTVYGTNRMPAYKIFLKMLNGKDVRITSDGEVDKGATAAAQNKKEKMKEDFQGWVYEDKERRESIQKAYNETFNNIVQRDYDGSHVKPVGMVDTLNGKKFKLHPWQKDAIWRVVQTRQALLGHTVGAGKTLSMIVSGMELKRLGLVKKPMYVLPNHLVRSGQFAGEFLQVYPNAKLLVATEDDFKASRRKEFMARVATGEWDGVILGHSSFELLPVMPENFAAFIREEITDLEMSIDAMTRAEGGRTPSVKQLEKRKERLEQNLKKYTTQKKDDTIHFEEMGIDQLYVDEAHNFKNLSIQSKHTRLKGVGGKQDVHKAFDAYVKIRHIYKTNGADKGVVFATGTPISNNPSELYTMLRYLQPTTLKEMGLSHFDAWLNTFGAVSENPELSHTGKGFKINERFAGYQNMPELMDLFTMTADIKMIDDLPELKKKLPKIRTGKVQVVEVEASDNYLEFLETISKRADWIEKHPQERQKDNHLKLTTDGRKASIDLRLIDKDMPDHPHSKINRMTETVADIWNETKDTKGTQMVFCDMGTPTSNAGMDLYSDMRNKLVKMGIPAKEVAFIHEHKSDTAKPILFEKVRRGEVRVLIGSTALMGEGTNVQQRMVALHHVDVPFKPSSLEQRNGRIYRYGNENIERGIDIFVYVQKGKGEFTGFDSYMWQMVDTKSKFVKQALKPKTTIRSVEIDDEVDEALSPAVLKAIATGNPRIMEKVKLDNEVKKLEMAYNSHRSEQTHVRHQLKDIPVRIQHHQKLITTAEDALKDIGGDDLVLTIDGAKYDFNIEADKKALYKKLTEIEKEITADEKAVLGKPIGTLGSAKLIMKKTIGFDGESFLELFAAAGKPEWIGDEFRKPLSRISRRRAFDKLPELYQKNAEYAKDFIKTLEAELVKLEKEAGKPFDKADELAEKKAQADALAAELGMDKKEEVLPEDLDESEESESEAPESSMMTSNSGVPGSRPNKSVLSPGEMVADEDLGAESMNVNDLINTVRRLFPDVDFREKNLDRWRRAVGGKYFHHSDMIKTRHETDISVICHELGHWWHERMFGSIRENDRRLVRNKEMRDELKGLDYDSEKQRLSEGFAEFLRLWLTGERVEHFAPSFSYFFENHFLQHYDQEGSFRELRETVKKFRMQGAHKFAEAQLNFHSPRSRWQRFKAWMANKKVKSSKDHAEDAVTMSKEVAGKFWDDSAPIQYLLKKILGEEDYYGLKMSENPIEVRKAYTMKAGAMAEDMITNGIYQIRTGKRESRGISQILHDVVSEGHEIQDFIKYIYAKHALTWYKHPDADMWVDNLYHGTDEQRKAAIQRLKTFRPKNPGISEGHANKLIDDLGNELFDDLQEEVTRYFDQLMRLVAREGGVDGAMLQSLRHRYPFYIPLLREMIDETSFSGMGSKGTANQGSAVKYAKGSDRPLQYYLDAWIQHTEKMVLWAQKASVMNRFINLIKMFEPGPMSTLIKKTSAPIEMKQIKTQEMIDSLEEMGWIVTPFDEEATTEDANNNINLFFNQTVYKGGKPIVCCWQGGQRVWFELHPRLFKYIQDVEQKPVDGIMRIFSAASRLVRLGATGLNPGFIVYKNFLRDSMERIVMSQDGKATPFSGLSGLLSEIYRSKPMKAWMKKMGVDPKMADLFAQSGSVVSTMAGFDRNSLRQMSRWVESKVEGKTITFGLRHPIDGLRLLFAAFENANRIPEFKAVYEKVLNETADREEAFMRASRAAQDVTTDFAKGGTWGRLFNQIIPFYNAGVQGFNKFLRGMSEKEITGYEIDDSKPMFPEMKAISSRKNAGKRGLKALGWITALSLLSWLLRDPEEEEKLNAWDRYAYFNFWINGQRIRIVTPFMIGAVFHGAVQAALASQKDDQAAQEYAKYIFDNHFKELLPMPQNVSLFKPIIDIAGNKSWSGAPIEPSFARRNKKPEDISREWNLETSKAAVKMTPLQYTGISPAQFEYGMDQYTGGMYRRTVGTVETTIKTIFGKNTRATKTGAWNIPLFGGMFARPSVLSNKWTARFYTQHKDMTQRKDSENPHPHANILKRTYYDIRKIRQQNYSDDLKDKKVAALIERTMRHIQSGRPDSPGTSRQSTTKRKSIGF